MFTDLYIEFFLRVPENGGPAQSMNGSFHHLNLDWWLDWKLRDTPWPISMDSLLIEPPIGVKDVRDARDLARQFICMKRCMY